MSVTGVLIFWAVFEGYHGYISTHTEAKEPYRLGSRYELECAPDPDNPDSAVYFVRTGVTLATFAGTSTQIQPDSPFILAKGATINPAFADALSELPQADRYSFSELDPSTSRVRLLITSLQPEDSGDVGCIVASATNISDHIHLQRIHSFTVVGPPKAVTWFSADGEEAVSITQIDIAENERSNIFCKVTFSTVAPETSIYRTGADGVDLEDITSDFSVEQCCGASSKGYYGFWTHDWHMKMDPLRTFTAQSIYNGRQLVCQSGVMEREDRMVNNRTMSYLTPLTLTANLTLNVTYAPRINCSTVDNHVTTICHVYGNPVAAVSYERDNATKPDLKEFRVLQAGDHVEARLIAEDIPGLSYTLTATSSLGTEKYSLQIATGDKSTSDSVSVNASTCVTFTLMMLSAFVV